MDLLQSHLLLGGWSAAGGLSGNMKPSHLGSVCETCRSTLQSNSSSRDPCYQLLKLYQGELDLLLELMGSGGNWGTLRLDLCELYVLVAFSVHQNLQA